MSIYIECSTEVDADDLLAYKGDREQIIRELIDCYKSELLKELNYEDKEADFKMQNVIDQTKYSIIKELFKSLNLDQLEEIKSMYGV